MIDHRQRMSISAQLRQQRLDELTEVIHLLKLAATVLIHFSVAREDMQFLEQLDGLSGS